MLSYENGAVAMTEIHPISNHSHFHIGFDQVEEVAVGNIWQDTFFFKNSQKASSNIRELRQ